MFNQKHFMIQLYLLCIDNLLLKISFKNKKFQNPYLKNKKVRLLLKKIQLQEEVYMQHINMEQLQIDLQTHRNNIIFRINLTVIPSLIKDYIQKDIEIEHNHIKNQLKRPVCF